MKTDNELIADFMNHPKVLLGSWQKTDVPDQVIWVENSEPSYRNLRYHESWDWLMPVVEKIRDLKNESPEHMTQVAVVASAVSTIRLWAIQKAVVEFIKWYNNENISR